VNRTLVIIRNFPSKQSNIIFQSGKNSKSIRIRRHLLVWKEGV